MSTDTSTSILVNVANARQELQQYAINAALPARIDTPEQAEEVIAMIADVEARVRQIEARIAEPKKRAHGVWKDWIALENEMADPGRQFAQRGRALVNAFMAEARRKAQQEADERALREQQEKEARALADAEALAKLAEDTGDASFAALADSVIDNVPTVTESAPVALPKLAGTRSTSTRRTLRVVNLRLLLAQIVAGKVPDSIVSGLDMKGLAKHVKETGALPAGVEWHDAESVTIGRKA
jgi:hypothetical protein